MTSQWTLFRLGKPTVTHKGLNFFVQTRGGVGYPQLWNSKIRTIFCPLPLVPWVSTVDDGPPRRQAASNVIDRGGVASKPASKVEWACPDHGVGVLHESTLQNVITSDADRLVKTTWVVARS